jgi:uncharacterized protein
MICSDYEVESLASIDAIGKQSMSSLGSDGFYTYEWLKTLEMTKPFMVLPQHFAVWEGNSLEAVALCFLEYTSQYRTFEECYPITRGIRELGHRLGLNTNPPLVCYSPSSFRSRILFDKSSNQREILNSLSKTMDDFCIRNKVLISSFPYVSQFDGLLMNELPTLGYLGSPMEDTYYLDTPWSSFENYLGSLDSNKRRNVRREIRQCADSGVTIQREYELSDLSDELSHLYKNLHQKYNRGRPCPLRAEFFNGLSSYAKGKVRLITARKNGKLAGFCLMLCHNLTLDTFIAGFDYNVQTMRDYTYFNLCFHEPIKMAIEEGLKRINFRGASDEAKQRRGFRRETMYTYVKVQNPGLRPMATLYLKFINSMRNRGVRLPSLPTVCNSAASP